MGFNKVTGVYGLLAILTGYQLSLMQLSTYLYSIGILVALVYLMPHIRRQSPFEVLALAWLYIADTVKEGLDNLRKEQERHGAVVPHETASSMILIIGLTLVRVYFGFIVMSFARQVLQKQMQIIVLEAPSDVDDHDGPFGNGLPEGEGRRGRIGRVLVSYGRDYWLGQPENGWADQGYSKQGA